MNEAVFDAYQRLAAAEKAQLDALRDNSRDYTPDDMQALHEEVREARHLYDNAMVPYQGGKRMKLGE